MKTLLASAALAATFIGLGSTAVADDFRHITFRESPFAPYRGIHPIGAETAGDAAHYAFDYDAQGRVISITRRMGDTPIGYNGNWDSFLWFAPQVRMQYEDGREIHTFYDRSGAQIAAHGNVYSAVYTLDESGERTRLEFFDSEGQPSESEWNIHHYEWNRSADGHVMERRYDLAGEMQPLRPFLIFHEVKLEYDRDGLLVFMRNYGLNSEPTNNDSGAGIDRITYDLDGNFVRWQVYDHAGNPVEGNRPGVHMGEHLYDNHGNKIGLRGFDRYGNAMAFADGNMLMLSDYDERGNRIGHSAIDAEWNERFRMDFTYSDDGVRSTQVRALDSNNTPVSHPALGGAAIVQFEYDEDGTRQAERFNADMSPYEPAETE
jgi:YD repeat-containing protein